MQKINYIEGELCETKSLSRSRTLTLTIVILNPIVSLQLIFIPKATTKI